MAEGRLRVIGVPPSGRGLRKALARLVKDDTVVTALDEGKLHAIKGLLPEGPEVEIAAIGDLVGRYLTMVGEPVARLCPKGQLAATVGLASKRLPSDSPLADSARFPGTADVIVERLGELRDWGIEPEDVLAVLDQATPTLAAKLGSLVQVMDWVREVMEETNRQFASDRVRRCLTIPPDREVPIRRLVVALGGAEKPVYESWLRWALGFGTEVVVLVDDVPGAQQVFALSRRCAERIGVKAEHAAKERPWYAALFSEETTNAAPEIEIVNAADPLSESEWAVRGCLREMESGALPHRIGIFARDSESYAPLLQSAAERLGVPLSANITTPLLTNGFAALTLRCLRVLVGEDVRALGRLAQSSYLRTGLERSEELRDAVRAAYAKGPEQWTAIADWATGQGEEFAWLRHVLQWRESAMHTKASLGGWLHRLRELIGGTQMVDFAVSADAKTRSRDTRAQTVLQRSVSDLAYVFDRSDKSELGLRGFVRIAESLWENETMVVEGGPNGVKLVTSTSGLTEYDTLFVVGMLEGTLPRRRTEDPLLFDSEREELSRLIGRGVRLTDSFDRAAAERDEFVRICASAEKRIVFSFPETDDSRDNVPAFYLEEVKRACPGRVSEKVRPRSQFVPLKEECLSDADLRVRTALEGPRVPSERPVLTTAPAMEKVRPDFAAGVSPEELALSLVCPFQSAMRYRLRLIAPARRRLMRSLRDLPATARLATTHDEDTASSEVSRAIDAYVQDVYPEFEPWELAMLEAAARRLAEEWVDREFRSRRIWSEAKEKTWADVRLDEHGLKNELKVGGRTVRLTGSAASLTARDGYTVMRFFDSSAPNLTEVSEVPEDNADAFRYGLYLMTQLHMPQRNPAVEVDGMDGRRVLAGFKNIRGAVKHDPSGGLEVARIADSRDVFFQNVVNRLKQAMEAMERADMQARPGKQCEPCPYGELCRVSSVFGESNDPFAEEAE